MANYFIKNKTPEDSLRVQITLSGAARIENLGHNGAIAIDDNVVSICLAPENYILKPATVNVSEACTLNIANRYLVEIEGEMVPWSFSNAMLPQFFKTGNITGIIFEPPETGTGLVIRNNTTNSKVVRLYRVSGNGPDIVPTQFTTTDALDQSFAIELIGAAAGWGTNFGNNFGAPA